MMLENEDAWNFNENVVAVRLKITFMQCTCTQRQQFWRMHVWYKKLYEDDSICMPRGTIDVIIN